MNVEIKSHLEEFLKIQKNIIIPKDLFVSLCENSVSLNLLSVLDDIMARETGKEAARVFMDFAKVEVKIEDLPIILEEFFRFTGMGNVKVSISEKDVILEIMDSPLFNSSVEPEKMLRPFLGVVEGFVSQILGKETKGEVKGNSYVLRIK